MKYKVNLVPTYGEDSSVMTLIIMTEDGRPIQREDLADLLRHYISLLEAPEEIAN